LRRKVKTLPPIQLAEVEDFINFLLARDSDGDPKADPLSWVSLANFNRFNASYSNSSFCACEKLCQFFSRAFKFPKK